MADKVSIHPDMGEFLESVEKERDYHVFGASSFYGRNTDEAIEYIRRGATEYEQQGTRALLDKVDASIEGRQRREYVQSVAGSFPMVPEYLAGMPMNMRRRAPIESDQAPLRIVVEPLVSAGISADQLARRGAAVAALVMRLSETRPVELWAAWAMRPGRSRTDVVGMVKLYTHPIDIGHVVAVMASREFARSIIFAHGYSQTGQHPSGSMRWGWNEDPRNNYRIQKMRRLLGLESQDVFIPGGFLSDADEMMRDPVAWVNRYLDPQRDVA